VWCAFFGTAEAVPSRLSFDEQIGHTPCPPKILAATFGLKRKHTPHLSAFFAAGLELPPCLRASVVNLASPSSKSSEHQFALDYPISGGHGLSRAVKPF
jgi:hypothetical protein